MVKFYDFTGKEYPPLNDVLMEHLKTCVRCQDSLSAPPTPNVRSGITTPKLCGEWFAIIQSYAQFEGEVNNIVAVTEDGIEAWKQESLWRQDNELP